MCFKCGQCLCRRLIILPLQCHCQFGKVREALCCWSTKRTFFCGTVIRLVLFTADRRWQQCRNQNRLELLFMTSPSDITGTIRGTVLVDVVLILHVSLTTKITVTLFTIISTYSPLAAEKSGGTIDRVTANSPYNGARCSGA